MDDNLRELERQLRALQPRPLPAARVQAIGRKLARRRWAWLPVLAAAAVLAAAIALWGLGPNAAPVVEPVRPPDLWSYRTAWDTSEDALLALLDRHGRQLLPRSTPRGEPRSGEPREDAR